MMKRILPTASYVAPFAVFLLFLVSKDYFPYEYPLRVLTVAAVLFVFSRRIAAGKINHSLASVFLGVLVFGLWIAPDLISHAYRQHWLFHNAILGAPLSSLPAAAQADANFLVFRILGTAILVPIVEELFWRGWLMRYLISHHFEQVRLGAYSHLSFWSTVVLFASEHGSYWDVALIAGIAYNWWMIRTGSLQDCILAHGVTNACLAIYILAAGQWQYWL
jgi:CAAX prenyl protease-like protein